MELFGTHLPPELDGKPAVTIMKAFDAKYEAAERYLIGDKWFVESGASQKKEGSSVSYRQYLQMAPKMASDDCTAQIDKDVPRTGSEAFCHPSLRRLMKLVSRWGNGTRPYSDSERESRLRRPLVAFAARNSKLGYAQGMNFLCAWLLCFMDEEQAFWVLCLIIEQLKPHDFFSGSTITPMHGFNVLYHAFLHIVKPLCPTIGEIKDDALKLSLHQFCTQLFISNMIDSLPVPSCVALWDQYMRGDKNGGDCALFRCGLVIIRKVDAMCQNDPKFLQSPTEINNTNALADPESLLEPEWKIFQLLKKTVNTLDVETIQYGLAELPPNITHKKIQATINRCRDKLAKQWPKNKELLSKHTHFSVEEVGELFRHLERKRKKKRALAMRQAPDEDKKQRRRKVDEGAVSRDDFRELLNLLRWPLEDDDIDQLFAIYDQDGRGKVDFLELVCLISTLSRGTVEERVQLIFDINDRDRDGLLNQEELRKLVVALLKLQSGSTRERKTINIPDISSIEASPIFQKMQSMITQDGLVSCNDFVRGVLDDPDLESLFSVSIQAPSSKLRGKSTAPRRSRRRHHSSQHPKMEGKSGRPHRKEPNSKSLSDRVASSSSSSHGTGRSSHQKVRILKAQSSNTNSSELDAPKQSFGVSNQRLNEVLTSAPGSSKSSRRVRQHMRKETRSSSPLNASNRQDNVSLTSPRRLNQPIHHNLNRKTDEPKRGTWGCTGGAAPTMKEKNNKSRGDDECVLQ